MCGIKPTDKLVWHLPSIKAPSRRSKTGRARSTHGELDFTAITQPWLRDLTLEWARHIDPSLEVLRDTFRVAVLVSGALNQRSGGAMDPARLTAADMDAAVDSIRSARRKDGELFTRNSARSLAHKSFALLDFGRRTGLMADVPTAFVRHHRRHSIGHDDEDENGKAIPEPVMAQLDAHLETFGSGIPYGHLTDDEVRHMLRTAYVLLRDTGRRPREICSLRSNCLEHSGDDYELIWDNYKSKRHRRRLLSRYLRRWVDAIPKLDSNTTGPDGSPLPFDRTLIYPYAFRHSYAQRHADAGVPIDVLRELMDHRQISTTMGYYKVSLKRKRAAVSTMRQHIIDRAGNPAPMSSNTGYEARSVAVPFGNCIEPSNVKAGGTACPIRFQCSGCGFYRPDPSYLPAIEEHINSLRADRETAQAMDVDGFAIRNLTEQIAAFQQVIATMQNGLTGLPDDERSEIEEASAVLRKARPTHGRTTLPLTVVNRRPS
ncbi:site-specific integrase [Streptomyces niveus]|uniref:site-specific integrase n=1 Tax=Streptomyces niveus TaxID=193462 RepID=UPI003654FD18